MTAPAALTIHSGNGLPGEQRRQAITEWLTAHGIDPDDVAVDHPITVLTVPYRDSRADGEGPWLIQVIVLTQHYRRPDGSREHDLITGRPVAFQRTVPLQVPFPADPTTDGEDHGQADRPAAEETPEVLIRDQEQEGVPNPRQGSRSRGPGEGQTARNEGAAKGRSQRGHEEVSEPEEERRPEEEVTA